MVSFCCDTKATHYRRSAQMKDTKVKRNRQRMAMLKQQFLQGDTGVFAQVLGDQEIAAVADELVEPYRERIYPPLDTLRLFVGQALSAARAHQGGVGGG